MLYEIIKNAVLISYFFDIILSICSKAAKMSKLYRPSVYFIIIKTFYCFFMSKYDFYWARAGRP